MNTKILFIIPVITILAVLINGWNEAEIVLNCKQPEKYVGTDGMAIDGSLSIREAKGDIEIQLGSSVSAEFAKTNPSEWSHIALTYQYQTCQLVNSTGCGGLTNSECRKEKKEVLDDAFDKINQEMRVIQKQREAAKKKKRQDRINACVAKRTTEYQLNKSKKINGGARANSPGLKGGTKTHHQKVCLSVGSTQIIRSATTEESCCYGGRCSVSEPIISDSNKKVCVNTKAWSESKPFGAGGCAKYNLVATFYNVATTEVKNRFRAECSVL